jgi:hypothetical protein
MPLQMSKESHGQTFMIAKKGEKPPHVHVRVRVREPIRTGSSKFRVFPVFPIPVTVLDGALFSDRKLSTASEFRQKTGNPGKSVSCYCI